MKGTNIVIAFFLLSTSSMSFALECDSILRHGLRNIEVSKSSEASISTKYFNHCNKNFSSMDDSVMGSIEVEVFGYGGGGGNFSRAQREERLTDWCKTNSETAQENKQSYEESQTIYGDAVAAWDNCNKLSSRDVQITPFISPDSRFVDISLHYNGATTSGIKFYGVRARGFSCETLAPYGDEIKVFDGKSPVDIRGEAISISCERAEPVAKTVDGQSYEVLDRGIITVQTASFPLQLFFPEEYQPNLPESRAATIEGKIRDIESSIDGLTSGVSSNSNDIATSSKSLTDSIAALNASMRGSKMLLVNKGYSCDGNANNAPMACPSGYRNSGAVFYNTWSGGPCGEGFVYNLCINNP